MYTTAQDSPDSITGVQHVLGDTELQLHKFVPLQKIYAKNRLETALDRVPHRVRFTGQV